MKDVKLLLSHNPSCLVYIIKHCNESAIMEMFWKQKCQRWNYLMIKGLVMQQRYLFVVQLTGIIFVDYAAEMQNSVLDRIQEDQMFDVNIMDALSEGGLNFRAYSSGYWPWKKKKKPACNRFCRMDFRCYVVDVIQPVNQRFLKKQKLQLEKIRRERGRRQTNNLFEGLEGFLAVCSLIRDFTIAVHSVIAALGDLFLRTSSFKRQPGSIITTNWTSF